MRTGIRRMVLLCMVLLEGMGEVASAQQPIVFDGQRAHGYLASICELGPRFSGSPGMQKQQALLEKHFSDLGGEVRYQEFDVPHPQTGQPVRMRNMVVHWGPPIAQRMLLCCHYDTRPFPDREPTPALREKPFLGANDGGSGVAMLMELANHMKVLSQQAQTHGMGVDFVFFDGEELVYAQGDKYFWGSEYFARSYRDRPSPTFQYVNGILLDMVAGAGASFHLEVNSLRYAPQVTRDFWGLAARLGVKEFVNRRKHEVLDDHLALNQIAQIPTCDIIDFDYPHWHRRNDLPAACSAQTMGKVGRVLVAWISFNASRSSP